MDTNTYSSTHQPIFNNLLHLSLPLSVSFSPSLPPSLPPTLHQLTKQLCTDTLTLLPRSADSHLRNDLLVEVDLAGVPAQGFTALSLKHEAVVLHTVFLVVQVVDADS